MINTRTLKTLEFLLLVLGYVGPWLATLTTSLDTRYAVYGNVLVTAIYALTRGLAKINTDGKNYWQTTEFYATVIGSVVTGAALLQDVLSTNQWATLQLILGLAMQLANGLRKQPEVEAGPSARSVGYEVDDFVDDRDDKRAGSVGS